MDAAEPTESPARLALGQRLALLLVVPLLLIGPSLLPGHRFLPQAPVVYPPLSLEYPEAAARASVGLNWWTGDRIFPVLSDQLEIRERVLAGEGVLYEDGLSLGLPLFGNAICGPLYPPNLLALALPPDRAAAPLALLALLLAGAGLWALLARLGVGELGCVVGALCLQGTGWGVANLHYGMKVDAVLWLPWCLWAVEGLRAHIPRSGAWLALFVACSFLAGFPPIAAFVLAATGLGAAARLRSTHAWSRFAAAGAAGLAVASLQLVPMAAASADSYRTVKDARALAAEAAPPAASLGLVVPELFGAPTEPPPAFGPIAAWWLSDDEDWERAQTAVPLEWDPFAGVVTLLLAVAGLASAGRRALAPLGLVLLALGWAQAWPGFAWLYALPGLGGGAPTRALAVAWIGWAWLAALGVDGILRGGRRRAQTALGLVALAALGLAASFANGEALVQSQERRWMEAHDTPLEEVRAVMEPERARRTAGRIARGLAFTGVGAAALALAAALGRGRRQPLVGGAALALLALEVVVLSRTHVLPRDLGGLPVVPESEAMEAVLLAADGGRVLRYDPTESGLGHVVDLARPNMVALYGGSDVSAYVAFTPRAGVDFFAALHPDTRVRSGIGRLPDLALLDDPHLDAARVTCILAREPIEHPRLEVTYRLEGFCVHRRLGPAPRAWRLAEGSDPEADLAGPWDPVPLGRAGTNRWRLDVGADGGRVLLSRAHTSGLLPSRGEAVRHPSGLVELRVPPGNWIAELRYRPPGWTSARFAAGLALLVLAAWFRIEEEENLTMRLQVLSSGSKGNATLIQADELRLLVDAGLPATELERRLEAVRLPAQGLDHIAVTHGHLDHARSAGLLSRRHRALLHCSEAIQHNSSIRRSKTIRTLGGGTPSVLEAGPGRGSLELTATILPHDAPPTYALRMRADGRQAVILTDMGKPVREVAERLAGTHILVLEFNYDEQMLAEGPYPPPLKRRVGGDRGHLSNDQAAQMLEWLIGPELHTVVLAHLSENNNTPELAMAAAEAALARAGRADVRVLVAAQHEVGPELDV